jgi:tRNA(Ile)-lysidine synthase
MSGAADRGAAGPLIAALEGLAARRPEGPLLLAVSGGLDSMTLLGCAATSASLRARGLSVLHVHHGLHPEADRWAEAVERVAAGHDVPVLVRRVSVAAAGLGIEAAARAARHAEYARALANGGLLLLAHHRRDQAETLLLRLWRGTGIEGAGAMRELRPLGRGWLGRPWLAVPREAIAATACLLGLSWHEDPANADERMERAWMRQRLWPVLTARYPAAEERLARFSRHARDAQQVIGAAARRALGELQGPDRRVLSIPGLLALPDALFGEVLRVHAIDHGLAPPGFHEIGRIRAEIIGARSDADPVLPWQGWQYRRYRDALYLLPKPATRPAPSAEIRWPAGEPMCRLPEGIGDLHGFGPEGRPTGPRVDLAVRWRRGSERLVPVGGSHHRELRLLFQELGVPPWQRARLPLVYAGDQLLLVPGLVADRDWAKVCPDFRVEWRT